MDAQCQAESAHTASTGDLTASQKIADTEDVDAALGKKVRETNVNAKLATEVIAQDLFEVTKCFCSALSSAVYFGLGISVFLTHKLQGERMSDVLCVRGAVARLLVFSELA